MLVVLNTTIALISRVTLNSYKPRFELDVNTELSFRYAELQPIKSSLKLGSNLNNCEKSSILFSNMTFSSLYLSIVNYTL
jgi:hypothetical protein